MLLSGLVLPGLGQLATGHVWRGLAFSLPTLAIAVAVVQRVAREAARLVPTEAEALLDPLLPLRLAVEVERQNAGFFLAATLALGALWAGSVADAWLARPRRSPPAASGPARAT